MTTQLALYNKALSNLGERPLSALTENTPARKALDANYTNVDDFIRYILEARQWNFALKVVMYEASDSLEPAFGCSYAYERPDDYVRLSAFCSDDRLTTPADYRDYNNIWYTDITPIYVSYVSIAEDFGRDLSRWPARFTEYAAAHLAYLSAMRITESREKRNDMEKLRDRMLTQAGSYDVMEEPEKVLPIGSWLSSRLGGVQRDRGNRGRLIG